MEQLNGGRQRIICQLLRTLPWEKKKSSYGLL